MERSAKSRKTDREAWEPDGFALADAASRATNLETTLQRYNTQIDALNAQIRVNEDTITQKTRTVEEQQASIQELEQTIQSLKNDAAAARTLETDLNKRINNTQKRLETLVEQKRTLDKTYQDALDEIIFAQPQGEFIYYELMSKSSRLLNDLVRTPGSFSDASAIQTILTKLFSATLVPQEITDESTRSKMQANFTKAAAALSNDIDRIGNSDTFEKAKLSLVATQTNDLFAAFCARIPAELRTTSYLVTKLGFLVAADRAGKGTDADLQKLFDIASLDALEARAALSAGTASGTTTAIAAAAGAGGGAAAGAGGGGGAATGPEGGRKTDRDGRVITAMTDADSSETKEDDRGDAKKIRTTTPAPE